MTDERAKGFFMTSWEPLQMMPADGWYAVFNANGEALRVPLVAWVLYRVTQTWIKKGYPNEKEKPYRAIAGWDGCQAGDNDPAEASENFMGYLLRPDQAAAQALVDGGGS